ncbi:tripartite tricarboxylate transporter TctB family protein [Paraburkholderia sp. JHI869]|uniref:tripartite tricarboxylate transporter TctB family protein n=1 Tax=Paraburkholderia sp. JHI869 TaxID=3112959 RepID=UPI003173ED42
MKSMKGDVGLAVCVIALAAGYLVLNMQLPEVRLSDPLGPKAFPALVGVGLIASALLLLLETRSKRKTRPNTEARKAAAHVEPAPRIQPIVLLGMIVWAIIYYTCFEPVGYLISTSVFLLGLLSYFNRKRHLMNVIVAFGVALAFDLVFSKLLGVPMPTGLLPF